MPQQGPLEIGAIRYVDLPGLQHDVSGPQARLVGRAARIHGFDDELALLASLDVSTAEAVIGR
jgi:hypothetical protein